MAPPVEPATKSRGSRRVTSSKLSATPPIGAPAGPAGTVVLAEGRVSSLSCTGAVLNLSLDFGGIAIQLRAPKYAEVEYLTTSWTPPADFNPCVHLRGHAAEVKYRAVEGRNYVGEVLSVEVKK